jgi:hypothetical protein
MVALFIDKFDKRRFGPLFCSCISVKFFIITDFTKPSFESARSMYIRCPPTENISTGSEITIAENENYVP